MGAKGGHEPAKEGRHQLRASRSLDGQKGKLAYMSKDLNPQYWPIFAAFIRQSTGKPVLHDSDKPSNLPTYGKKTGISRNIDAKARAASHAQYQTEHPLP